MFAPNRGRVVAGGSLLALLLVGACGRIGFDEGCDGPSCPDAVFDPADAAPDCPGWELEPFAGGTGTADDPYRLCTPRQLAAIASDPRWMTAAFRLDADLDLRGLTGAFPMIGSMDTPFAGTFDGASHTIGWLTISGQDRVGMFSVIDSATIHDLTLTALHVEGTGTATGSAVGGLVGLAFDSRLERCHVTGRGTQQPDVVGLGAGALSIGGLVGSFQMAQATQTYVADCTADVQVSAPDAVGTYTGAGGLIGSSSYASLLRCAARGAVDAPQIANVGGLVGNCWSAADLSFAIDQSWSDAEVTGQTAGGLVGFSNGFCGVRDSYAMGPVHGATQSGGLVGSKNTLAMVMRSYAVGAVDGGMPGALVGGLLREEPEDFRAVFWSSEVTPGLSALGSGTAFPELRDVTGAQLRDPTTFSSASWDVGATWALDPARNTGLPHLTWQAAGP